MEILIKLLSRTFNFVSVLAIVFAIMAALAVYLGR
jgi:hypothetical protein